MSPPDRATNRSRPILRVRTGCLTCRSRKKKCGEERPVCRGCTRNHLTCTWPSPRSKGQRVQERDSAEDSSPHSVERDSENDDQPQIAVIQPQNPSPAQYLSAVQSSQNEDLEMSGGFPLSNEILEFPAIEDDPVQPSLAIENLFQFPSDPFSYVMPRNPSLLPQIGNDSFELLSYYLSKTANSMGNGSTDANPFIVELVPLAFSSELILQLMLTQSAAHRAVTGPRSTQNVADRYYNKSLRLFRNTVNSFISGSSVDGLVLATGALVMCFTETAKGDIHGAIFDHLSAANSILVNLMSRPHSFATKALSDFLVEYYTYTATLSMISLDARFSTQVLLTGEIEQQAHALVKTNYIGHLCGCWLILLLHIPRVFEFGRQMILYRDTSPPTFASPDDIVTFSEIYHDLVSFVPNASVNSETSHAGYIFQQALLVYLLTSMGSVSHSIVGSKHGDKIKNAIQSAIEHLGQIPPTSRINTSLCWPLAIVGSCTADHDVQSIIRLRLQSMIQTIALGNMEQTLILLEHIWTLPLEDRSPWTICTAMQEHELWISFA